MSASNEIPNDASTGTGAQGSTIRLDRTEQTDCRLHRWQVSFRSGRHWYPVGEYLALDEASAIERAIDVLGQGAAYRADRIPWDAAPLSKLVPISPHAVS